MTPRGFGRATRGWGLGLNLQIAVPDLEARIARTAACTTKAVLKDKSPAMMTSPSVRAATVEPMAAGPTPLLPVETRCYRADRGMAG